MKKNLALRVSGLLFTFLLILFLNGCSSSTTTQMVDRISSHTPSIESTITKQIMTETPVASATTIPNYQEQQTTEGLVASPDSIFTYEFQENNNQLEGSFLVLQERGTHNPLSVEITLVDWDGRQYPYLEINHSNASVENTGRFVPVRINNNCHFPIVFFYFAEYGGGNPEILIFHLENELAWALIDACETSSSANLVPGPTQLGFQCSEDLGTWYFVNFDELAISPRFSLPHSETENDLLYPEWVNTNLLLFRGSLNQRVCSANLHSWDPYCREVQHWVGPISPDRQSVEIRTGNYYEPISVGSLNLSCLMHENSTCTARETSFPDEIASATSGRFLADSAWLPESQGLLYVVFCTPSPGVDEEEHSEIWYYEIASEEVRILGDYPGSLSFGNPINVSISNPPPWSPDGSSVVMSVGEQYYLFNVETAELTPLTEGGILLGAITLP